MFLIMSLFVSSLAWSQTLNLNQMIQETQSGSLQIQKAESAYRENTWKKREAYAGFLPTITGEVSYLTDKKYMLLDVDLNGSTMTIPQIVPTTLYTLKASLPIFDGFASTNHYLSQSALERSAENDLLWTQFQTNRQAILQFYKTLASEILKEVAEQNLKTLTDHLKDVQAYKRAGVSTKYDVLRVEVQVSEAQSEILNTQDNLEMSQYKLGEVLGKDRESRVLNGKLPILKADMIKSLDKNFLERRKDLQSLREKTEAFHYHHSATNRYWVPKIFLVGGYQHYNNINSRFDDEQAFRDAYQVGVNLTWNLFDGMASTSKSGISEQQALQADVSLKMAEIKAQQDFEFWRRKYLYFCTVYQSRLGDVERSTEAVRLAKEGRKAGTRTNTELLDAEADLYRAKAGEVNAQIGAVEALVNLELASGQKLYDFN